MQFLHKRAYIEAGSKVKITLDKQANVKLMTDSNFNQYKNGRKHMFYGGRALQSPIIIPIPNTGMWNITIDLGIGGGSVKHSIQII